jgi:signal transduction histidine kinase
VVTVVLVALSLSLALITDLYTLPDRNYALVLMIPVLIGMVRASPNGMRAIVVIVVITDLVVTTQSQVSTATWAIGVATLIAVCVLALRINDQWFEILALKRTATDRAERAERHEEQLVEFMDLVYHDVRLPLEAARIQLKALRTGASSEDPSWIQARCEDADLALVHMATMLKDLVDIGRQEAGHLEPRPVPIDLKKFLGGLIERIVASAERERFEVIASAGAVVDADYYQLERIVGNLVSNALKYSAADSKITVRVATTADEVDLSVRDQGMGIAAEDLTRIFQRGYRAREARHRADGAGLGLYAVRLFVEAHHGRVWVESKPAQGSTFHVMLPRSKPEARPVDSLVSA